MNNHSRWNAAWESMLKVEYIHDADFRSTAYVNEWPGEDGLHAATNKHSDEPLLLERVGDTWRAVETPELAAERERWWKAETAR